MLKILIKVYIHFYAKFDKNKQTHIKGSSGWGLRSKLDQNTELKSQNLSHLGQFRFINKTHSSQL